MKKNSYETPESYLLNFTELYQLNEFPLIQKTCLDLRENFRRISYAKYDNILQQIADLLDIDAQLQLFYEFRQNDLFKEFNITEEEVVKMIEQDKNVYYRQLAGIGTNQSAPIGIIYLSEKDI